jgi:hypothetical protein
LSDADRCFCDQELKVQEFDGVIKKLKLDKSPGDDGLTNNFYIKFWDKLKYLYFNMIKECYTEGELSISMKRVIVALLFKKGETWLLKNYRPISLTNADYKILAFVLADRLQKVINIIIDDDQTAYIKKRFIGNSARNIIDVMEYCENFNHNGILLCLDFEKAFDSLEWSFLFTVLKNYNFGPYFIRWVEILYKKPILHFKNNGWISRKIEPSRGIRQGCPVSALLFILSVEILAIKIRNSENIKGLEIPGSRKSIKLKQYADDTTLILRDECSIQHAIECVDEFGRLAGLIMNKNKTIGILLGPMKGKNIDNKEISFTSDAVRCLGIYLGHDKTECYRKNWLDKLKFFEQTLERWRRRKLTLFGKIVMLKTFALSKFIYAFSVLETPPEIVKTMKDAMFKFLWNGKDKIKRNTIIGNYEDGGIKMIDLELFIDALNIAWAARILRDNGRVNVFFKYYAHSININVDQAFNTYVMKDYDNVSLMRFPLFYRKIIYSFSKIKLKKDVQYMNSYDFLSQPIFMNERFVWKGKPLCYNNWIESGIFYVYDIVDRSGLLSCDVLLRRLCKRNNWISEYITIRKVLTDFTKCMKQDVVFVDQINRNNLRPIYIRTEDGVIDVSNKRSRSFYNILVRRKYETPIVQRYWNSRFTSVHWKKVFYYKLKCVQDNKIAEFNLKIIYKILPCGNYVNKWNKNVSRFCQCCGELETIEHLIFSCSRIQNIWKTVSDIFKTKIDFKKIVIGFTYYKVLQLEYCISVIAFYIYKCWLLHSLNVSNGMYKFCDIRSFVRNELWWKKETLKELRHFKLYEILENVFNRI